LEAELEFVEAQRALTPGQICALYDGDRLLGGAVFAEIWPQEPGDARVA
jgi:tRNA-uridine 2-sulfurtransferase